MTYDPGCTAETGSVQAWEKLNTELIAKYGAGFDIGDSDAQFRVADGPLPDCNYIPYSTDGVPLNFGTENKRCNEAFVPRARAIQSTVQ